jgi:hypothetical protein
VGVELARAHERAHLAADVARYAPDTEQTNVGCACMRRSARVTLFESRPVISVEEEEGERVAKRSVHLDARRALRREGVGAHLACSGPVTSASPSPSPATSRWRQKRILANSTASSHPCAFVPKRFLTVGAPRPRRLCAAQAMRTAWVRAEKGEGGEEGRPRDGPMSSGL